MDCYSIVENMRVKSIFGNQKGKKKEFQTECVPSLQAENSVLADTGRSHYQNSITILKCSKCLQFRTNELPDLVHHVNKECMNRTEKAGKWRNEVEVYVMCTVCDYRSDCIERITSHTKSALHKAKAELCWGSGLNFETQADVCYYKCLLCKYTVKKKARMVFHLQSVKHELKFKLLGKQFITESGRYIMVKVKRREDNVLLAESHSESHNDDIMTSNDLPDTRMQTDHDNGEDSGLQTTPSNSAWTPITNDEQESQSTRISKAFVSAENGISSATPATLSCFLCMEFTGDDVALQRHLVKNHEVKTEVLQKFMSLVDLSANDILQKRKTGTEELEIEHSESASNLPVGIQGRPSVTSLSSICEDSDGLVIDLDKDPERVDSGNCESVSAANGSLTDVVNENAAERMELQGFTANETPPSAEHVNLGIQQAAAGPVYNCWHYGCNEFFPNAADVQLHYLDAHARDHEELPVAVTMTKELQCAQCDQVFRKKEDFNKHRYCHEMDKAVECSSCQHRFQSIVEFRRHMQVVHCEELTTEQQALYEASVAAASSLALLGASGLENMTAQASKRISPLQTGKGKTLHGTLRPHAIENQSIAEKMDGRLDENSNSCLQAKFEGSASQGSGSGRDERMHKCDGTCGQNGMVSKCSSCKAGLSQVNGLLEHHQHTEKSRRKRSIPTKTITSPSEDKPSGENELTPTDLSVMDLTGRRSSSVDSETLVMSTAVSPPFTSPSVLLHRPQASVSAADRPFRCAVCKVSYSQKTQLDSHILSQQHVSRCAKAVDSTARQAMSSPAVFSTPYSSGDQGNFADLLRQQKFPIGQFLQYGIPFMNPMMSPVLSNYAVPPIMMQSAVENDVRVPTSSTATTCYKNSSDVPSTVEPMSRAESVPTKAESSSKSMANDDSVGNLDLACSRCHKVFPTVEVMNQHQLDCLDATPNILAPDPHNNGRGGGQTMMDSILQKIGYECVKQFNEFRQKPKHSQQMTSVLAESGRRTQPDKLDAKDLGDCLQSDSRSAQTNGSSCIDLAESRNVYVCLTCSKCFSDIFVLKSHQEIVHMEIVPIDVLEKLQQDLRRKCEKARIVGGNEEPKVAEKTRIRRQDSAVTVRSQPNVDEEEMKMKQQQLQLAAAYQSMQLGLMMSMGMLPQVPQRLSGPTHMAAISELFAQQPYSIIDPVMMMQLQQQQNKSASASATAPQSQLSSAAGQKSARTRISEQQLQILRANFDINNSPTEEQIQEMSEKTGLVTKVIKHWFRNTLFKERQRNKDSPYNFNNPPATTLNLEDYERSQALLVKKESSIAVDENSTTSSVNTTALTNANTDTRTLMITEAPSKSKPFCNSESSNRTEESYAKSPTISDSIGQPIISGSSSSSSQGTADIGSGMIRLGAGLSPMTNALYGLSPPVNWQERRAGRTRFSNQQIQVLQEFFDRNPYPKDDEVESLSRVLGLGIRVIVVWFQNARQRVRKTEGQSSSTLENPRTSQYQCGKCSALFDQHLEFLRHQMSDHAPSGDVASRAASQSDSNEVFVDDEEAASRSSLGNDAEFETPSRQNLATASRSKVECDRCDMVFDYEEQLNAHQRTMHGGDSILPRMTARNQSEFGSRKSSEDGTAFRQSSDDEEHRGDRRMRTTLAQDQLDYLYEKFAVESNPSRPALEEIAAHLNLKPRVVQVWFQNTRARERRGQHRVNAQKTIVKCGFCESVFRGKSALDAHVAECHSSHLNVLAYPIDLAQTIQAMTSSMEQSSAIPPFLPPPPLVTSPMLNPTLQTNMNYLYEKSLKQYMTKLSNLHVVNQQTPSSSASNHSYHTTTTTSFEPSKTSALKSDDVPLDLTTTSSASSRSDAIKVESDDLQNRLSYQPSLDDSYSETYSENDDAVLTGRDSTSPSSALGTNPSRHNAMLTAGKRYRTQMSSLQIKVMRTIFNDYKTPSLAECEVLGQQIGLPRRVVQVWFQNSRAKMKKSSFLGLEKLEGNGSTSSSGGAFPGICVSLSECGLCNVAYGVNHTMQDHLFTKMHIDHIMAAVNTNEFRHSFANSADGRDTESIGQRKSSSSGGDFPLNQSVTISSIPNSSNSFESAAGNVLSNTDKNSVVERKQKRLHETSPKVGKELQNETKKNAQNNAYPSSSAVPFAGPVENSLRQFMSVPPASAADLMGMMMPYFYQAGGIPAIFPGLAPIQLLSQAPNILPGVPNAIFNPAMCGIQLAQLQIPKRAIEQLQERLKDKTCSLAHYSEDCLSNAELRSRLTPNELASLSEQMIHVGFICKKCHLVFPQVSACNGHQAALCYKDAEKSTSDTTLKLEQLVYHCSLCKANCSTAAEFKTHCGQEKHRKSAQSGSRCGRTAGSNGSSQARFGARRVSGESRATEQGSCNGESMSLANVKLEKSDG